jgi:hypothetical protein
MERARFARTRPGCENEATAVMLPPVNYKGDIERNFLMGVACLDAAPPGFQAGLRTGDFCWTREKHESPL